MHNHTIIKSLRVNEIHSIVSLRALSDTIELKR